MRDHKTETLCDFNGQFLVARRQMFDLIEQSFQWQKRRSEPGLCSPALTDSMTDILT